MPPKQPTLIYQLSIGFDPLQKKVLRNLKVLILLFWGFVLVFLSLFLGLLLSLSYSKSMFFFSWNLLASILSSQADPPTLKNLDFASAGARFLKNQGLRYKDAFDCVLGLSWTPFRSFSVYLWGFGRPLHRPQKASTFLVELF